MTARVPRVGGPVESPFSESHMLACAGRSMAGSPGATERKSPATVENPRGSRAEMRTGRITVIRPVALPHFAIMRQRRRVEVTRAHDVTCSNCIA
jgi:hypothetical protein